MKQLFSILINRICLEVKKPDAKLLPLRLFIGLGWLRAGVEKLTDPSWHSGLAINEFFQGQIASGDVPFAFYESLLSGIFTDYAGFMSTLIMAGEFYVGLAIIFGFLTKPALIAGLFMNLNFILAGQVNPSAFYIVIQMALLASNVGQVLGIDALTAQFKRNSLPNIQPSTTQRRKVQLNFGGAALSLLLAVLVIPFIQTFDPAASIEDPAMLLMILFGLSSITLTITGICISHTAGEQVTTHGPQVQSPQVMPPVQSQILGNNAYAAHAAGFTY